MTAKADKNKGMHAKRLGRELAMQFLFQYGFSEETDSKKPGKSFLSKPASSMI